MKKRFYDVHVFFSREDGYSVAVEIESSHPLDDEDVIQFAASRDLFTEDGDQHHVDNVSEISEGEYILLTL